MWSHVTVEVLSKIGCRDIKYEIPRVVTSFARCGSFFPRSLDLGDFAVVGIMQGTVEKLNCLVGFGRSFGEHDDHRSILSA